MMEQEKKPVAQYYYSEKEWSRIGCGPLPSNRDRSIVLEKYARGNPKIDGNAVKGYN